MQFSFICYHRHCSLGTHGVVIESKIHVMNDILPSVVVDTMFAHKMFHYHFSMDEVSCISSATSALHVYSFFCNTPFCLTLKFLSVMIILKECDCSVQYTMGANKTGI